MTETNDDTGTPVSLRANSSKLRSEDESEHDTSQDLDGDKVKGDRDSGTSQPKMARVPSLENLQEIERIGQGSFAIVTRVRDSDKPSTDYALREHRVRNDQPEEIRAWARSRFLSGARLQQILGEKFEFVPKVYAIYDTRIPPAMLTEYIPSVPPPQGQQERVELVLEVAKSVQALHARNVVHRDLRPPNIALRHNRKIPFILDFDLAYAEETSLTFEQGEVLFPSLLKSPYFPPNFREHYASIKGPNTILQLRSPAVDVYMVSALLYWAVMGSAPPIDPQRAHEKIRSTDHQTLRRAYGSAHADRILQCCLKGLQNDIKDTPDNIELVLRALRGGTPPVWKQARDHAIGSPIRTSDDFWAIYGPGVIQSQIARILPRALALALPITSAWILYALQDTPPVVALTWSTFLGSIYLTCVAINTIASHRVLSGVPWWARASHHISHISWLIGITLTICSLASIPWSIKMPWNSIHKKSHTLPNTKDIAQALDTKINGSPIEQFDKKPETSNSDTEEDTHRTLSDIGGVAEIKLLPDGQSFVYVYRDAVWYRNVDSTTPRKLFSGQISSLDVSSSGEIYFVSRISQKALALYRISNPNAPARLVRAGIPPYFCLMPDQGQVLMTATNLAQIHKYTLTNERMKPNGTMSIDGQHDAITGIACDGKHGRLAILKQQTDGTVISISNIATPSLEQTFFVPEKSLLLPQFSSDGDKLYYIIDHGRGFELEGRMLTDDRVRVFQPLPRLDGQTVAYSIAQNGHVAYVVQDDPKTTVWRLPGGEQMTSDSTWTFEVPTVVGDMRISPDERTLAFTEYGSGTVQGISTVQIGSTDNPNRIKNANNVSSIAWSPNGDNIAYIAYNDGESRMWLMNRDGTDSQALAPTPLPSSVSEQDLAWLTNEDIVYRLPDMQGYALFNHTLQSERSLGLPAAPSLPYYARPSPSGDDVALSWANRPDCGLATFSIRTKKERILSQDDQIPIGWSPDGQYIYTLTIPIKDVLRVPVGGEKPTVWRELDVEPGDRDEHTFCGDVFLNGDVLCRTSRTQHHLHIDDNVADPSD